MLLEKVKEYNELKDKMKIKSASS